MLIADLAPDPDDAPTEVLAALDLAVADTPAPGRHRAVLDGLFWSMFPAARRDGVTCHAAADGAR